MKQTSFMIKKYTRVFQNHVSRFKIQTMKPPGEYEIEPINKTVAQWLTVLANVILRKRKETKKKLNEASRILSISTYS